MIDVEGEPNGDSSPGDIRERARDEPGGWLLEVEVVQGEVEPLTRGGDELADVFGDLEGALATVGQCADFDGQAKPRTRR